MTHPIDQLFERLRMVEPYPTGVVTVPARLPGTGFFPGGTGLWQCEPQGLSPLPMGGTLVLGHNLDSKRGFAQSVARGGENLNGATWRPLTEFLVRALPGERVLANCFFSNFLIGLIEGSSAVGRFPGTEDLAFVERCRSFLVHQVQVVRPSLLLVLGIHTPRLLAALSPAMAHWQNARTFVDIDRANGGLIPRATIGGVELSIVALTHPCHRRMNVRHRSFRGLVGDAAEAEMVRRAACPAFDST
jgi:hypothetical protein